MIVMTDGAITAQNRPEDVSIGNVHSNRPTNYAPHVSAKSNQGDRKNMQTTRTRGNASTSSANNSAVGRFKRACEAAKAENILVFTIGFQINAGSLPDLILEECATSSAYYYHVEGLDLTADVPIHCRTGECAAADPLKKPPRNLGGFLIHLAWTRLIRRLQARCPALRTLQPFQKLARQQQLAARLASSR